MNSKNLFHIVILICVFQLIIFMAYSEIFPSLVYPSFAKKYQLNLVPDPYGGYPYHRVYNYTGYPSHQNYPREGRLQRSSFSMHAQYHRLNTKVETYCKLELVDGTEEKLSIDARFLLGGDFNRANKGIYTIKNKFWDFPVEQKNFIRDGSPYRRDDLVQLEVFLRKRVHKFHKVFDRKDLKSVYLVFDWRANDSNEVVNQTVVQLM